MSQMNNKDLRAALARSSSKADALNTYVDAPSEATLESVADDVNAANALRISMATEEWSSAIKADLHELTQRPSLLARLFARPVFMPAAGAAAVCAVALSLAVVIKDDTTSQQQVATAANNAITTNMVAGHNEERVFLADFESADLDASELIMRNGMES